MNGLAKIRVNRIGLIDIEGFRYLLYIIKYIIS